MASFSICPLAEQSLIVVSFSINPSTEHSLTGERLRSVNVKVGYFRGVAENVHYRQKNQCVLKYFPLKGPMI
ncbi:hypothetical protein QQP08_024176 [Theobroma cacao]|nr:hypothetical protein QQP08_024176 [Theobroma cacao]